MYHDDDDVFIVVVVVVFDRSIGRVRELDCWVEISRTAFIP